MKGTVKSGFGGINVRRADGSLFGAGLQVGDSVYGDTYNDGRNKIHFSKIYRVAGAIQALGELCNAAIDDDGEPPVAWMTLTNEAEPGEPPPPPPPAGDPIVVHHTELVMPDGTVWIGDSQSVLKKKL